MDIRKAYRYRLYPTRAQADRLEWVLRRCQELYNAALQERRDAYRMAGVTVGYYAQKRELPGVKAAEAGVVVVGVNLAGTSQVCSGCGRVVPKTFSDRWHTCPYEDCGLSIQRDHNSARTILTR